jgi:hypothetical protein
MQPGWIYEVVASTRGERGPHAAPIGILTPDGERLKAELYQGSTTLANIGRHGVFGINLVHDPVMLHKALHHRDRLRFTTDGQAPGATTPFLEGADAWLELEACLKPGQENTVIMEAGLARCRQLGPVSLINRAKGLLLESLVLSTRRHILPVERVRDQLLENARVIAKVAPGSSYAEAVGELLAEAGLAP